jgi:ATP-dependent DNA helicase RecG
VTLSFFTTEVTMEVTTEVTMEVHRLVTLMKHLKTPISRRELQLAMGLKNAENFRKSYLVPALNASLIEMTVPDKHNSRMQKYRLTAAGKKSPISS